jgi:hypothetical protein
MQRWPDTLILTCAPRQSRSDRRHFAAPLTGLTEGQRRLRRADCSATWQSETDRQSGPAEGTTGNSAPPDPGLGLGLRPGRRRTPLRPTQGSDSGSAPEDGELRSARPRARTRAMSRKTANSAPPDPGLRLRPGLSRQPPPRPTRGSDSASATEDRLDLGFGGASTSPNLGRRPVTSTGGAIIALPRADSGRRKQDRRPIWLAPPDRQ